MKKTKLTIDLGNIELTAKQKSKLLDAVHKTVGTKLKSKANSMAGGGAGSSGPATLTEAAPATKTATVSATFKTVDAGLSELTASIGAQQQTVNQTGKMVFNNITTPAVLMIKGKSLGTTTVTVDIPSNPQTMDFQPGTFFFFFQLS